MIMKKRNKKEILNRKKRHIRERDSISNTKTSHKHHSKAMHG